MSALLLLRRCLLLVSALLIASLLVATAVGLWWRTTISLLRGRTAISLLLVVCVRMFKGTLAGLWIDEEVALVSLIPLSVPWRWKLRVLLWLLLLVAARAGIIIWVIHCKLGIGALENQVIKEA